MNLGWIVGLQGTVKSFGAFVRIVLLLAAKKDPMPAARAVGVGQRTEKACVAGTAVDVGIAAAANKVGLQSG